MWIGFKAKALGFVSERSVKERGTRADLKKNAFNTRTECKL